jgi:hypothetical protein
MGMYNEVFARCPKCGRTGYMQIPQVVLGFGGFDIDDTEATMSELSERELIELKGHIMVCDFVCCGCNYSFNPYHRTKRRTELIHALFDY